MGHWVPFLRPSDAQAGKRPKAAQAVARISVIESSSFMRVLQKALQHYGGKQVQEEVQILLMPRCRGLEAACPPNGVPMTFGL